MSHNRHRNRIRNTIDPRPGATTATLGATVSLPMLRRDFETQVRSMAVNAASALKDKADELFGPECYRVVNVEVKRLRPTAGEEVGQQ